MNHHAPTAHRISPIIRGHRQFVPVDIGAWITNQDDTYNLVDASFFIEIADPKPQLRWCCTQASIGRPVASLVDDLHET